MTLRLRVHGGEEIQLGAFRGVVAGYTGRDSAAVQAHIAELAAIGVAPPSAVPMFYPVASASMTTQTTISESAEGLTSGEVEPVYIRHRGRYFLGVGSDHTDRELERIDVADSKRACQKPIGDLILEVPDLTALDLDRSEARCFVDGRLYQRGTLDGLRRPQDVVSRLVDRLGLGAEDDFVCLGGTLPLLDGGFQAGTAWRIELELPDGTQLSHEYRVTH